MTPSPSPHGIDQYKESLDDALETAKTGFTILRIVRLLSAGNSYEKDYSQCQTTMTYFSPLALPERRYHDPAAHWCSVPSHTRQRSQ